MSSESSSVPFAIDGNTRNESEGTAPTMTASPGRSKYSVSLPQMPMPTLPAQCSIPVFWRRYARMLPKSSASRSVA
jgi:hypothetical protein